MTIKDISQKNLFKNDGVNHKWTFGFSRNEISKTITWGVCGGFVVSLIEFPYKIIIGKDLISRNLIPGVEDGLIYSIKYLFAAIVIIPFIEELLFRGYVYRILRNKFNVFWGFAGSMTLFSLAHGINSGIVLLIISSFILTCLYEKTRALGVCVIAHTLWNFSWYVAVFLFEYR